MQKIALWDERTWSLSCEQVGTGSERFEQVRLGAKYFFLSRELHALRIWLAPKTCVQFSNRTSLETLRTSEVHETALRHASIGVRCEVQPFLGAPPRAILRWKLSISQDRMCTFTRIRGKTKTFWLLIFPAQRLTRSRKLK